MGRLNQRHILVAISGGIAAYKGAELVRLLKKQGALVRVVLSRGATEFITPSPCRPCRRAHAYRAPRRGGGGGYGAY